MRTLKAKNESMPEIKKSSSLRELKPIKTLTHANIYQRKGSNQKQLSTVKTILPGNKIKTSNS